MALSKHERTFILTVTEIDATLLNDGIEGEDEIIILFAGKVMPSTKKRLATALGPGVELADKVLT